MRLGTGGGQEQQLQVEMWDKVHNHKAPTLLPVPGPHCLLWPHLPGTDAAYLASKAVLPPLAPPTVVAARLSLLLEVAITAAEHDLQMCTSTLLLLAVTLLRAQEEVRAQFLGGLQGQVLLQLLLGIVQASELNHPGSITYDMHTYGVFGAASAAAVSQGLEGHLQLDDLVASLQHTQVPGATAVAMLVTWCFMEVIPIDSARAAAQNNSSSSSSSSNSSNSKGDIPSSSTSGESSSSSGGSGGGDSSSSSSSSSNSSSSSSGPPAGEGVELQGAAMSIEPSQPLKATSFGCILTEPVSGEGVREATGSIQN
jgi:hypothetical protein